MNETITETHSNFKRKTRLAFFFFFFFFFWLKNKENLMGGHAKDDYISTKYQSMTMSKQIKKLSLRLNV